MRTFKSLFVKKHDVKPRLVVSVSNDLVTDQRVKKVCETLYDQGFDILLFGRKYRDSLPIDRPYKVYRFKLFFNKKIWFYAELNIRIFFKLLFSKKDVLLANDLDTLLPNFLIAKLFGKFLVYDSHELFTEVPELQNRKFVKSVWLAIEQFIFPKLKHVITVNEIIAGIYNQKYNVEVHVVRNITPKLILQKPHKYWVSRVKQGKKMLILQGSGINKDRGAEEAIQMMQYLENILLYIIGGGDAFNDLKQICKSLNLENKVIILDKMPYQELLNYTQIADLGLSLDKGTNLNYEYSLPNKVFDYIRCQTPLMVSNRKIVAKLVNEHNIGVVFNEHNPKKMAEIVLLALENTECYQVWLDNLKQTSKQYSWEQEAEVLKSIYSTFK